MSKKYHSNFQVKTNWELIISVAVIMLTVLGTTVPFHIQSTNQINAIHQEMKDFHGRLCAIEERNKK
jgi:hypothetical protein